MSTILICGHRSYASRGLKDVLEVKGHKVLCFSRGDMKRERDVITGPVKELDKNPYISEDIDVVINFILLQNTSVEENLAYIDSLITFCNLKKVKRLIQISSISAYPNDAPVIREDTPIETDLSKKGGYGIIKSAADNRLESAKRSCAFEILFVRPGYIVAEDNPHPFKGIAKFFGSKLAVLIGNKHSTLPCILRSTLHACLEEIVVQDNPLPVYLLVEGVGTTKYSYFKSQSDSVVIPLPKCFFEFVANTAKCLHVIDNKTASGIKGVFKVQKFDNTQTKSKLHNLK